MRLQRLLLILFVFLFYTGISHAQSSQYADDCIENVDNATVLLPSTVDTELPNGSSLEPADTVAVRNTDGDCVGYGTWDGTSLSIAAAGPTSIDDASSGYQSGAAISFEVFDASEESIVDVGSQVTYTSCDSIAVAPCRSNGTYADGAFFVLKAFTNSALPVEFSKFEANRSGERVRLEWTTAQETNNAGFEVQHRRSEKNSASWKTLRFVEGTGTTSETTSYSIKTKPLEVGDHQFRLRQIDQDGSKALSKNVKVEVTLDKAYQLTPVAPNPVNAAAQFSITVREKQQVTVSMYNVLGQRVATLYDSPVPANQQQEIRLSAQNRPSGAYFLRIEGETFSETQRMTVVR